MPAKEVRNWETQFLKFMKEQMPEVKELIAKERKLTDEVTKKLTAAIEAFQPQYKA